MPPRSKLTQKEIVDTAVDIVRKQGDSALNARNLAAALGCSTQPIFSKFATMDDLRFAVIQQAEEMYKSYIDAEIASGQFPSYKASGMAYIRFAKEEKELFRLLYMRDRRCEPIPKDHALTNQMETIISENTGLSRDSAKLFHLEMWAFVHGIATMFATEYFDIDWSLVSKMLTDIYQGLIRQSSKE